MSKKLHQPALRLFYCYSHADSGLRKKLDAHLSFLKRDGLIAEWYDGKIVAGEAWDEEIKAKLAKSQIILLLVSAEFNASKYVWDAEMPRAIRRHREGRARVIPVIVRPVEEGWRQTVFSQFQALPSNGKAVTKWPNRDSAWADVANGVRVAIGEFGSASAGSHKRRRGRKI